MSTASPSTRIDLRVDAYKKSIISRAAAMLGVNITQFIMERVFPEAERIVAEGNRTRLPKKEWERFLATLDVARHEVPGMVVARLAGAMEFQGQALGKQLLRDALLGTLQAADIAGLRAVVVHAKDEGAKRFYERFRFEPFPAEHFKLALLLKDL